MTKPKITVTQVSYHRNGICGEGFHAVLFTDPNEGPMVGVVFDGKGRCAVLNIPKLSDPDVGVRFGANSWRGDHYEDALRKAIQKAGSTLAGM